MEKTDVADEGRVASETSSEERELAGYIDGLIARILAERVSERPSAAPEPHDPTMESGLGSAGESTVEPAPAKAGRRASMRAELLELFRSPKRLSASATVASYLGSTAPRPESRPLPPEARAALRPYLPQAVRAPETVPTGLAALDSFLAGGLGPGVHLVSGAPGTGKTAFLESVGWEAVSSRRPVLYYSLKEGNAGAWAHLVNTLASVLDYPVFPPERLRDGTLTPRQLATLASLDLCLQDSVLPWLSLIETIPVSTEGPGGFLAELRLRAFEAGERHGSAPLVLIDDLDRLLITTAPQSPENLLCRLEESLAASSVAGLIAVSSPPISQHRATGLPAQTALALISRGRPRLDAPVPVTVEICRNIRTGRTGSMPLLLHRPSGLFVSRE